MDLTIAVAQMLHVKFANVLFVHKVPSMKETWTENKQANRRLLDPSFKLWSKNYTMVS